MKRSIASKADGASPEKLEKVQNQHGVSGTPVQLVANYFKLNRHPFFVLSQYRVDFEPEIDVTQTKKNLLNANKAAIGSRYIFDGASMYLTQKFDPMTIHTTYNNNPMKITIRWTGCVESDDHAAFQLFNLIFREAMEGLKLQNVRRDLYDPAAKIDVPQGNLELWPGYITSIRSHENDILVCAEIIHKIMRKETILDIAKGLMVSDRADWQEKLKQEIIGTVVLTEYTNKTYQIDDIDFTLTPQSTFSTQHSEDNTTYLDYYKTKYGIVIKDDRQFMLVSNPKERDQRAGRVDPIYLVPELCRATGMTDKMRANYSLMQNLSQHTRMNPEQRFKELGKFNKRIQETFASVNVLGEWKMELDASLLTIPGRELSRESIRFGNDEQVTASDKADWTIKNKIEMYSPARIVRWMCIFPKSLRQDTESFLNVLTSSCESMKLEIKIPALIELEDERQESYIKTIRECAAKRPNLFLVILPTNRADRYSAVKTLCVVELGIPSQIVIKRILAHKNVGSVATKIAVQMSTKLGGIPWLIKLPVKGLMTVGFDVSIHPTERSMSVGAMVATMDIESGAFFSTTSKYRDGNEMNIQLADHMRKALNIYKEKSGSFPQKIVFYRDGVGEGQIPYVMDQEVNPLLKKLEDIYGAEESSLAYIIVNKRINSRIGKKSGNANVCINPKPGTVVDREITLPGRNDFYLISQHVGQGSVSPTYYNIIHNTTGLNKDKLEILTFKFTHLYYNWSGTVRIPSVCQYAKKLAFMTSQSLQGRRVHENLERSLYFL